MAEQPVEVNVKMMFEVPTASPVTKPLASTAATPRSLELQVPPVDVVERLVVLPTQKLAMPVIAAGLGLIETVTLPSGPQQPPADCARK